MASCRCSELCHRDKRFKAIIGYGISYSQGFKRCTQCRKSIATDLVCCPCCGQRLKFKPRSKKYRDDDGRY